MAEKNTKTQADGRRTVTVQVALHGQTAGQPQPTTRAYLFDRAGRLLDSKPGGAAPLQFDLATNQDYRVTVGPDLLANTNEPPANLAAKLAKTNAVSRDISQHAAAQGNVSIAVGSNIWICWFPTCIDVHGTVKKDAGDGTVTPICAGLVEIYEVDLACTLDSFTFTDLSTLKYKLIDKLGAHASVSAQSLSLNAAKGLRRTSAGVRTGASVSSSAMVTSAFNTRAAQSSVSLPEAATTLANLHGPALKQYMVANKGILTLFLCELIPDYAFCWEFLGKAAIQSDGTFSAEVCFWCPDDLPDLYFEVTQNISGSEIEISDPQIACSTYYGYDGSQSVDITVDDLRAIACLPSGGGPGYLYVWPTAIGNIDLGNIDGLITGTGTGLLPGNTPFGGELPLQMMFHPNLPTDAVKYYRWSYKFDDESDFSPIFAPVTHRYMTTVELPGPVILIHLNSVNLGPKLVNGVPNLFEIPNPLLPWVDIDDPADRPFAYFDSTGGVTPHKSGMCTLLLEMFDKDGKFVPCNNTLGTSTLDNQGGDTAPPGPFTYILPEVGGPPDSYTNAPPPNITDHGRMMFRLRIDNNMTVAELPRVATPLGSTDTDPCGLLHYNTLGDNVEINYVAWHPNNFLDWNLEVWRGLSGLAASILPPAPITASSSGSPGFPAAFNNSAGTLLGPCAQAAFAVRVYCAARATNGYGRQSEYDSEANIAFALLHP